MKRTPWHFGIAAAVAIACGLSVSGYKTGAAPQDKQPTGVEVKIDNFSFGPAELTISVGTQVTWTNRDDVPHNVISMDKAFASPVLDTDEKFSHTFTKPGTYPYYCSIHPKMTAKIVVR